ncbi:MAG: PIN domain-containing protein [Gemmataceae bacterium]
MLLDSSGLLCLLDAAEKRHEAAKEHYFQRDRKVIHNYVLSEFISLAISRLRDPRPAVNLVREIRTSPHVELYWVDEELHDAGMGLLDRRRDKTYSLCDAVSFVLMRRLGLTDALTTDRHFTQEGFVRLLA